MAVRSMRGRLVLIGAAAVAAGLLVPSLASAATAKVNWGNFDRSGVGFNTLQPGTVTVSKGDKVTFTILGFHTVVIPKAGAKVPPLLVPSTTLNPATNDPGGAPYWWGGTTPLINFNLANAAPSGGKVVNGRTTVNSGALNGDAPKFTVTFAKTGTFKIRCAVHPNMSGTVRVVAKSGDTPAKRKARAAKESAAQLATVAALVKKADKAAGSVVTIGSGTKKAEDYAFHPANRKVAPGGTVTFSMAGRNELHTVTFGPKAFVQQVSSKLFPTGPANPSFGSEALYPSDNPALGAAAVTATSHGNGFVNSGLLAARGVSATLPRTFSVTFPTAGTFTYICLYHPFMRGTITVG
jgi:plastocyanin